MLVAPYNHAIRYACVIDTTRLRAMMDRRKMSQAELARRIGVSQATVNKLAVGHSYGSKYLHRIARELLTTPAYLAGETDDPDAGAPLPPPEPTIQFVTMPVALPSRAALARMFEGLLAACPGLEGAELADELAALLPIGLGTLKGPLIEPASDAADEGAARPQARHVDEPARQRA